MSFLEIFKKYSENLYFLKNCFHILPSFRGRMLKSKNLKMGTSSTAQFTLIVRTAIVYIANWGKHSDSHFDYVIVLGVWNIINLSEVDLFSLVDRANFGN